MTDRGNAPGLAALTAVALAALGASPSVALPVLASWAVEDHGFDRVDSPPPGPPPGGSADSTNLRYVTYESGKIWYGDRSDDSRLYRAEDRGTWPHYDFDGTGYWGPATTSALGHWGLHPEVFATSAGLGRYYWGSYEHPNADTVYYAVSDASGQTWTSETLVTFGGSAIESVGVVDAVTVGDEVRLYVTAADSQGGIWAVHVAQGSTGDYTTFGATSEILSGMSAPGVHKSWTPTGAVRQTSSGGWIMALADEDDSGVFLAESADGLTNWSLLKDGDPILPGDNAYHSALVELDLVEHGLNRWDVLYDARPKTPYPGVSRLGLATLEVTPQPVPEPASCVLLALAVGGIGVAVRKRTTYT